MIRFTRPFAALTHDFRTGTLPAGVTHSRASVGWAFVQPNTIRNPTMAGTPGALPTNWAIAGTLGTLSATFATVVVGGITYLRTRLFGTTSTVNVGLYFEAANFIPALDGQTWGQSFYAALSGGSLANITAVQNYTVERTSGGSFVKSHITNIGLTGVPQQFSATRLLSGGGTTGAIQPGILLTFAIGAVIDITFDIGLPTLAQPPVLTSHAIDAPRWPVDPTFGVLRGLYVEPAATNNIRNASGIGAVVGTPGTQPTNWSLNSTINGLTRTIVGTGVEDGLPYLDVRFVGTPTADSNISVNAEQFNAAIAASIGQTWIGVWFARVVGGSMTNLSLSLRITERTAGGSSIPEGRTIVPQTITSAPLRTQRMEASRVFDQPTAAAVSGHLQFDYITGSPVDITMRVGLPQLVQAPVATSPIVTTSAALLRSTDIVTIGGQNGIRDIDIYRERGVTTLQSVDLSAGSFIVPTDPSPLQGVSIRGGWSPLDLGTDLIAWWDAERSDLVTRDGSNLVSSWKDIVAGYDAVQATAGFKPVYGAAAFNGRPGITGDGVDDVLTIGPVPAGIPIGAVGSEMWGAVDQSALAADTTIRIAMGYGFSSAINRYLGRSVLGGLSRAIGVFGDGAGQKVSTNISADLTGRHVVRAAFTGTAGQADIDGIAGPSVAGVPATTNNFLRLFGGSGSTASNLWQGGISSLLITKPLTAAQANQLRAYLARRV